MRLLLYIVIVSMLFNSSAMSAEIGDYLILKDIGIFKLSKPEKFLAGFPPIGGTRTFDGAVAVSDHFDEDHSDTTYEVGYYDFSETYYSPTVRVTQHAGGESDKWLLHEMEGVLRSSEKDKLGKRSNSAGFRRVGTADIFVENISYYWISGKITVFIECMSLTNDRKAPLPVVQAYLDKYPPTLPPNYKVFNTPAHDDVWIKDEMTRRLWLAEKWLAISRPNDPKKSIDTLENVVESMSVFLDYRYRYYRHKLFRRASALDKEKNMLLQFANNGDEKGLRVKLSEYQRWWDLKK